MRKVVVWSVVVLVLSGGTIFGVSQLAADDSDGRGSRDHWVAVEGRGVTHLVVHDCSDSADSLRSSWPPQVELVLAEAARHAALVLGDCFDGSPLRSIAWEPLEEDFSRVPPAYAKKKILWQRFNQGLFQSELPRLRDEVDRLIAKPWKYSGTNLLELLEVIAREAPAVAFVWTDGQQNSPELRLLTPLPPAELRAVQQAWARKLEQSLQGTTIWLIDAGRGTGDSEAGRQTRRLIDGLVAGAGGQTRWVARLTSSALAG